MFEGWLDQGKKRFDFSLAKFDMRCLLRFTIPFRLHPWTFHGAAGWGGRTWGGSDKRESTIVS